jgi:isopenicillin N synthase-like dioxygenase
MIGSILNRLTGKTLRSAPRRVRLSMEPLEARDNPA